MKRFAREPRRPPACMRSCAWLVLIACSLSLAPVGWTEEPPVFALTGARIVPVSGKPLDKGTIVIRNGVIEAVGANVQIPADARVLDCAGLTVYPGLIDALSDVALEEPRTETPATSRTPSAPGRPRSRSLASCFVTHPCRSPGAGGARFASISP